MITRRTVFQSWTLGILISSGCATSGTAESREGVYVPLLSNDVMTKPCPCVAGQSTTIPNSRVFLTKAGEIVEGGCLVPVPNSQEVLFCRNGQPRCVFASSKDTVCHPI